MKSALVALLGVGIVSASLIKQNIGENMQRKNLAEVDAPGHDLSGAVSALFAEGGCEVVRVPPREWPHECDCGPNNPPQVENPCPDLPSTDLPEEGILAAFGVQTAATRTVEQTCLHDTACHEEITES